MVVKPGLIHPGFFLRYGQHSLINNVRYKTFDKKEFPFGKKDLPMGKGSE